MKLNQLLEGVEVRKIIGEVQKEIDGIACHSQQVKRNYLFAALRGMELDGHHFIDEAIERGAGAILLEEGREPVVHPTMIFVTHSRQALAKVSSNFYSNPSSQIKLIGITGTNGKTTTSYLLESIFREAGEAVGVIGTINYRFGDTVKPAPNTTPESLDLQRTLWEMRREGASCVVLEVSSHGLDLDRVFGCQFDGAVFTNLTSEHLDYHKTLDRYFESKRKLFSEFLLKSQKARRFAVTNGDDPRGEEIVRGIALPVIRYGFNSSCDISTGRADFSLEGISCEVKTPKGEFPLRSKLIGRFNLQNILAAVAAGVGMGLPQRVIRKGVEAFEGVPGRFEKVENQKGIHIIVDYAHTHDALERVLQGLREILRHSEKNGKIITVFGCGGDRDRAKRPMMAEVTGRYSDLVILTSDNPRTEDPLAIMGEAEKGFHSISLKEWLKGEIEAWRSGRGYLKIPDRRQAIRMAIRLAQSPDTVLIAGKGHEDYQIIGRQRFPFDDRLEARKALEEA